MRFPASQHRAAVASSGVAADYNRLVRSAMAEDPARRQARPNVAAEGPSPNCYVQMEHVSDKLKVLDCQQRFCAARDRAPLERWCFAAPARNPSIQFMLFLDLCSWLMAEITGDTGFFRVDKFDDPNTSVNKLMLALRKLEFGLDFPTSKLKQAHGEAAVGVLDFLTDRCALAGGGIEDEIEAVEEEETLFKESAPADVEEDDPAYKAQHEILKSGIDPRVADGAQRGPAARVAAAAAGARSGAPTSSRRSSTRRRSARSCPRRRSSSRPWASVSDARDKINLKENYINKQFEHDKQSYATLKQELDAVERSFNESTENVNKLTNELGGIAEQLDEMKGTMADRGNSMTDTSPLVQIKQALKQIKQEVVTFDLQIGVVGHTLMQQKLRHGSPNTNGKGFKMRGKQNTDSVDFEDESDMESL
ncbi:hypothetical protein JL720_6548 [Aureococcus anophagefferens]|nr:hypothetical protein JL720_6548 [Aureococcus anophagefferens]